jgi:hypothetical protein
MATGSTPTADPTDMGSQNTGQHVAGEQAAGKKTANESSGKKPKVVDSARSAWAHRYGLDRD